MSASAAPKLENVLRISRLLVDATPTTFWNEAGNASVSFPRLPVDETQITPRPEAKFTARQAYCSHTADREGIGWIIKKGGPGSGGTPASGNLKKDSSF